MLHFFQFAMWPRSLLGPAKSAHIGPSCGKSWNLRILGSKLVHVCLRLYWFLFVSVLTCVSVGRSMCLNQSPLKVINEKMRHSVQEQISHLLTVISYKAKHNPTCFVMFSMGVYHLNNSESQTVLVAGNDNCGQQ